MEVLSRLVRTHRVSLVAIGNGKGHRQAERLISELIKQHSAHETFQNLQYTFSGLETFYLPYDHIVFIYR